VRAWLVVVIVIVVAIFSFGVGAWVNEARQQSTPKPITTTTGDLTPVGGGTVEFCSGIDEPIGIERGATWVVGPGGCLMKE
jgi:hypothetical protein